MLEVLLDRVPLQIALSDVPTGLQVGKLLLSRENPPSMT